MARLRGGPVCEERGDMPNIGWMELLIIFGIILLLFGATRLPKLGKSLGQSVKGFKQGLNESIDDSKSLEEGKDEPEDDQADKA